MTKLSVINQGISKQPRLSACVSAPHQDALWWDRGWPIQKAPSRGPPPQIQVRKASDKLIIGLIFLLQTITPLPKTMC